MKNAKFILNNILIIKILFYILTMNIGKEIKKLAVEKGVTLTHLAKCISNKKSKHYSVQNLSAKLKKGTINCTELMIILDELGYSIKIEAK